jgi:hypothetical protein
MTIAANLDYVRWWTSRPGARFQPNPPNSASVPKIEEKGEFFRDSKP